MEAKDMQRLQKLEERIREIAEDNGLIVPDRVIFEIASPEQVMEGRAYNFPTNFQHWSHGADFEKHRTIYEHTGVGLPYEQVWNMNPPKAYIMDTNPFALNVMVVAHVYGHVDFFLRNANFDYVQDKADMVAEEARRASRRFYDYETKYGLELVERTIEAAKSLMWHQPLDLGVTEEEDEEVLRQVMIRRLKAKWEQEIDDPMLSTDARDAINRKFKSQIETLRASTPPKPRYDILLYILRNSDMLEDWQKDILRVVRRQARVLAPQMRTKLLNEGWATFWHLRIMRQLYKEGLITDREHGVFNKYHANVARPHKAGFNWYNIGLALFEHIKERWDRGQFGSEWRRSSDPFKRSNWDTDADKGMEKIFEVADIYSDRMAIETFFTEHFIHENQFYIYVAREEHGRTVYRIAERDPDIIRNILLRQFSGTGPIVTVEDGNALNSGQLYLRHRYAGTELDPMERRGVLENTYYIWGRPVYIETIDEDGDPVVYKYDGDTHSGDLSLHVLVK